MEVANCDHTTVKVVWIRTELPLYSQALTNSPVVMEVANCDHTTVKVVWIRTELPLYSQALTNSPVVMEVAKCDFHAYPGSYCHHNYIVSPFKMAEM